MHSYKIKLEDCPECGHEKTLEKIINNFSTTIQNHDGNEEVGSVVKEKIEDFKNDLKQEKKRLSRQEYEND
tara:strand:+ start:2327 stop:2539 length:213 start_codon:yes stop_codon:yes gene_type:complete